MVIFNRYKIVTAGFEKASKKLIHTGLREIGSFTSLSAEEVKNMKLPVKHYFTGSLFFLNNRIM